MWAVQEFGHKRNWNQRQTRIEDKCESKKTNFGPESVISERKVLSWDVLVSVFAWINPLIFYAANFGFET